jgi:hypothetical protein
MMTNLSSIAGGMVWSAVACLLMLVALEPVELERAPAAAAVVAGGTAA